MAAGDDTVIFCEPELAEPIENAIMANTARPNTSELVGLGQCVKMIGVSEWWDFEFCSKWSFSDGSFENWVMCRDVRKIL